MALKDVIEMLEYYREQRRETAEEISRLVLKSPGRALKNMEDAFFAVALGDEANDCLNGIRERVEDGWSEDRVISEMTWLLANELISSASPTGSSTSVTANLMDRAKCAATARVLRLFQRSQ